MEINVFEYANPGHITLIDSVVRIFSSDPGNKVRLFVSEQHEVEGLKLINRIGRSNSEVLPFRMPNTASGLKILITPDHQLKITYQLVKKGDPAWLIIHNIDDWFELGWKRTFRQVSDALIKDKNLVLGYYLAKRAVRGNRLRKAITKAIIAKKDSNFVVLNKDLKVALSEYVSSDKIKIIPFSIHDPEIKDLSEQNIRVRICIPGILSQKRRDYLGVFQLLESLPKDIADKIELDLLGRVSKSPAEMSNTVVEAAQTLINKGFHIHLRSNEYVEMEEFDRELGKADIILGNLNLDQGGGSLYGKTKESGVPFTMVRAGKPGILPLGYSTLEGFEEATIYYSNYKELRNLLVDYLLTEKLEYLKANAKTTVQRFTDKEQLERIWE